MLNIEEPAYTVPSEGSDHTISVSPDTGLSNCHFPTQQKRIECIICYSAHNLSDRLPRKLYCGHTFCQACLKRLEMVLNEQKWIPCPQCRQSTPCPRGGSMMLDLDLGIFLSLKTELDSLKPSIRPDTDLLHKKESKGSNACQAITRQPAALCQDNPREPHFRRNPCAQCTGCCCV
uniref:Ring finger protein 224 n=1 Tax=Callorhinchus milii TaxID=7868 RepID=A0A4W3J4Q8_CALMI|eukprot:gi/632964751/ref/XP_007898549.1/ PREDICTED: RING finger protein 224 [Callorhinchus milii]